MSDAKKIENHIQSFALAVFGAAESVAARFGNDF